MVVFVCRSTAAWRYLRFDAFIRRMLHTHAAYCIDEYPYLIEHDERIDGAFDTQTVSKPIGSLRNPFWTHTDEFPAVDANLQILAPLNA